jgi:RNA polymerase sigma-70 factor (ECF subfamily)
MKQDELLACRIEVLHRQIWDWSAEELCALEADKTAPTTAAELLPELPDETLALAVQKAFLVRETFTELFVTRYGPYLARWLFRWGTEAHQALDIIQQLYLKFYETRLGPYRPAEWSFRAYLRQSAYNLWVEIVCRSRKLASLDSRAPVPSTAPGPEQALLDREAAERIDQALGQLRPLEQRVLKATMAGRSAGEIADELGLRKEQVFMQLFRGRRRLEQLLQIPTQKRPSRSAQRPPASGDPPSDSSGLPLKEPNDVRACLRT